jgi:hypothetical protein
MLYRMAAAALTRWHELTSQDESDRGDSPVPTVIIWIGIAIVAVGLIAWVGTYVVGFTNSSPSSTLPSPTFP